MRFEDLDQDTQSIIDCLVENSNYSRERAILILIELGMVAMQASGESKEAKQKIINHIDNAISKDPHLKYTANLYKNIWHLPI